MTDLTKNDVSWNHLFEQYGIVDEISNSGKFVITATQINEVREARLMTKFDSRSNLPQIFSEHNLSILPITRRLD